MSKLLSSQGLSWVRQSAAAGSVTCQVLYFLLQRVDALEAAQHRPHQGKLDRLIALGRDDDAPTAQPAPPAAPAGGLVEMVEARAGGDARAAIREVAAWLDQRGQHGCSLLVREEADQ